jgi:hypothetical protein
MNDEFLTKYRKAPPPEFAESLYQRINQPMQAQSPSRVLRPAALTLSLLAVLGITLLLSPSARAFAQSLLKQIGGYTFTQGVPDPLDASRLPAPLHIVNSSTSISIELTSESLIADDPESAGSLAGFTVRTPSHLPSEYVPMDGGWRITTEGNSTAVTNGYYDTTKNFFFLVQWKFGEGDTKSFTRQEIEDVTVRGQSGVWIPSTANSAALVWEENGITYSLIGNALSLDEMLKVAESLDG